MAYNAVILKYFNSDVNIGELTDATQMARIERAGDSIVLQVKIEHDAITACCYQVKGSTVLIACCSLLAESMIGKSLTSAKQLTAEFFIEKFALYQPYISQVLLVLDVLKKL